ncbi:MAG: hypothetical protein KJN63_02615 [Acidimicrobiia bacterium]|nr:hypothetical protein [Acidimicrobiia bacterium]
MSGETGAVETERRAVAVTDHPLRVIDLIDGAFAALRYRPRVMFLSLLWIVIPMSLLEGWNARGVLGGGGLLGALNDPDLFEETANQGTSFTTTFFTYMIDWLRISLIGVSVAYLVNSWADGRDPNVAEVIRFTVRIVPVWVLTFIMAKVAVGIGLLLIIPGVALALAFTMVSPIIAIEQTGPLTTLKRAWSMMRRRTAPLLGLYVACAIVGGFVSSALTTIPSGVALFVGTDVAWPLITVGSIVSTSLLAPFNGAAMTLMYHDIRFRTEGLDLKRTAHIVFPSEDATFSGPLSTVTSDPISSGGAGDG